MMNTTSLRKLAPKQLKRLLDRGIVDVTILPPYQAYADVNKIPLVDLPEFAPFKKLRGKKISISQAARKYNIRRATLSGWVKRYDIPKLAVGDHGAVIIDEAFVAFYAKKYGDMEPGPGRRTDRLF